mgnify:CR=1 FL=1
MPKMKTSRAAAKRFKVTGTGKLKRNKAYTLDIEPECQGYVCQNLIY